MLPAMKIKSDVDSICSMKPHTEFRNTPIETEKNKAALKRELDQNLSRRVQYQQNIEGDVEVIKTEAAQEAVKTERARVVELLAVKDAPEAARLEAIEKGYSVDASYKLFWLKQSTEKVDLLEKLKETGKGVIVSTSDKKEVEGKDEIPDVVALARTMAKDEGIKVSAAMSKLSASKPEQYQKWLDSQAVGGNK